jgi:GNAT superfamily N-acetyltransferase
MSCKIDVDKSKVIQNNAFLTLVPRNKDGKEIGKAEATILKTDRKFIWLLDLQVIPECRDQKVGSKIIGKLAQIGKMEKAELVYAYPAEPSGVKEPIPQEKIENFYKNNGFVPCAAPKDVATLTNEGLEKKGGVCLKLGVK